MHFDPGLCIQPCAAPLGFSYGTGCFGPEVECRPLDSIRKSLLDPDTFERYRRQSVKRQIIKRNEEPADVAGTVLFLASDASDFMTGQTLNVDGGRVHY